MSEIQQCLQLLAVVAILAAAALVGIAGVWGGIVMIKKIEAELDSGTEKDNDAE